MKTKYKYIEFEKGVETQRPCWYGRLLRTNDRGVVVSMISWEWKARTYNTFVTAAEHRDIAHFLDELNKEKKP